MTPRRQTGDAPVAPLSALLAPIAVLLAAWWAALAAWLNPADAVENLSDWQYEAMCFVMRLLGVLLLAAFVVALLLLYVKGVAQGAAP